MQVVEFLRSTRDFQQQVDLLSGLLQGDPFASALLNDLLSIRDLVHPFLAHFRRHSVPLRLFCAHVMERMGKFPDIDELEKKIGKIKEVKDNLEHVKRWFSQDESTALDTITPLVSRLWKSGHFVSYPRYYFGIITRSQLIRY